MSDTFEKVKEIIVDTLGVDHTKVTLESTSRSLESDSLDNVGILLAIEKTFKIDFPDGVFDETTTVGAIVKRIDGA